MADAQDVARDATNVIYIVYCVHCNRPLHPRAPRKVLQPGPPPAVIHLHCLRKSQR